MGSDTLSNPISSKEIEKINFPTKKRSVPDGFSVEFYHTFKEEIKIILLKLFLKANAEKTQHNSFYDSIITLIPKPHRDPTKKDNFSPITLMNVNAKILNIILGK